MRSSERFDQGLILFQRLDTALLKQREERFPQHALRRLSVGWWLLQQLTNVHVTPLQERNSVPTVFNRYAEAFPSVVRGKFFVVGIQPTRSVECITCML